SVGVFLVLDKQLSVAKIKAMLNQLSGDIIDTLNRVLRMKITIVISKLTDSIVEVPDMLEKSRKALRFRDLHTSNQMLDMDFFMPDNHEQAYFPSNLEREIVHAVSLGIEDEAIRLIEQYLGELQQNYSTELMVHQ